MPNIGKITIDRHILLCVQLHFNICKETGVKLDNEHWYKHVPKSVETCHEGKVIKIWNQQVQTNQTIPNSKLDIIIHDNEKGTCMSIAVAISLDRNVIKKEAKKVLKYRDLTTEIQCMQNVKSEVIPIIIWENGTSQNHSENTRATYRESKKSRHYRNSHTGHCTHTS
jgi:uncharacterized protein YlxP (DUF503 family)